MEQKFVLKKICYDAKSIKENNFCIVYDEYYQGQKLNTNSCFFYDKNGTFISNNPEYQELLSEFEKTHKKFFNFREVFSEYSNFINNLDFSNWETGFEVYNNNIIIILSPLNSQEDCYFNIVISKNLLGEKIISLGFYSGEIAVSYENDHLELINNFIKKLFKHKEISLKFLLNFPSLKNKPF